MNGIYRIICAVVVTGVSCMVCAGAPRNIRWHNEESDTTAITEILTEAHGRKWSNLSECTGYIARKFIGRPYVAHTLEGETEDVTVNLDELDCTTLVDVAAALAYTVGEGRTGWQDFVYNLERMRYRSGKADGYASRLHYNCEWAMDNIHRGNVTDVTDLVGNSRYAVRSIDYMSQHRDSYPALKDSATFERIKQVENGFRNHRFPYIRTADLGSKDVSERLRDGDIIAFVSNRKDLDVTHLGIIVKEDGKVKVLHASSSHGKVEISESTLPDFVKRNRYWIGIRVYRLKQ